MCKEMQDQTEHRLEQLLANVHRWISFAEAKNGALLAISGAGIVGMLQLIAPLPLEVDIVKFWYGATIVQLLGALCVAVVSFLPRMKIFGEPIREKCDLDEINIAFFEDSAKLRSESILRLIGYQGDIGNPPRYLNDMARQLSTVSQICSRKYKLFYIAAYLLLGALLTPIVLPVILIARRYELA